MQTAAAAPPARTEEQRREALRRANDIRSTRARFKEQMKATGRGEDGKTEARNAAVDLATEVPRWVGTMSAYDLLMAIPKVGRVKANRILNQCRISVSKTLGGMSDRQRVELVAQIRKL